MWQNWNWNNVQYGAVTSAALDQGQAEELAKTMTVGHTYLGSPANLTGGAALTVENIDGTLRSVTYDNSHIVLWSSLPQDRAYSLVEQFVRTNSYGDGGSAFVPESGSPSMNDSSFDRHAMRVVFLATRRGVSLPATLVRMQFGGDLEAKESESGSLWMLEKLERALYKGLADFSNAGKFDGAVSAIPSKLQNIELLGLEAQILSGDQDYTAQSDAFQGFGGNQSVVIDRAGELLDESSIEDLANIIVENFGHPSEIHMAPKNMSDFIKQFFPKERVNNMGVMDGKAGYIVKEMVTTAGPQALKANVFLKPKETRKPANDRQGVPSAPASVTAAQAASDSKLVTGDIYMYEVTAANEQGEGANAAALSAAQTISADGNIVTLTIAAPAAGAPTHYAVYRTSKNGAGARQFIGYVKATGASTAFVDRGEKIAGGATAYMLDMRPDILVWKQLAPMMKINLAQVSLHKEFVLFLAGCLMVFAPRKLGMYRNIGRAS